MAIPVHYNIYVLPTVSDVCYQQILPLPVYIPAFTVGTMGRNK